MRVDTRVLYLRVSSIKCFLLFFSVFHTVFITSTDINGYQRRTATLPAPLLLLFVFFCPPPPTPFFCMPPFPLNRTPFTRTPLGFCVRDSDTVVKWFIDSGLQVRVGETSVRELR